MTKKFPRRQNNRATNLISKLGLSLVAFSALCVVLALVSSTSVAQATICETQMVPMRDGTKLFTQIYRPDNSGQYPVMIGRTPYSRLGGVLVPPCTGTGAPWVQNGYVSITQDVRGTVRSEGTFHPFFQEQNDGYDTIEWADVQPWSNGDVAMDGGSYPGVVVWQPATAAPPSLKAITPWITAADYHDDWVGRNGVFDLQFNQSWGMTWIPDQLVRRMTEDGASQAEITQAMSDWNTLRAQNNSWFSALPLSGNWGDTTIGSTGFTIRELAPHIFEWYKHPTYDAFWQAIDVDQQYENVVVPALINGGWYDLFAVGTIDSYIGMKARGGTSEAREGTMLTMDCCGHGFYRARIPGEILWGPSKLAPTLKSRFVDYYTKGVQNGIDSESRVQLSVMVPPDTGTGGDTFVFKTSDYPVPGTQYRRYNLRSGGKANTRLGDGVLDPNAKSQGPDDNFSYDPLDPVPTVGGNDGSVALDQSAVEMRNDVLVYTSAPLAQDLAVIGRVSVSFWAKTSAPDTDFTAKLVDVHLDGYAHNVVDRIVRARYRKGSRSAPELITPHKPYQYEFLLGDTATIFKKGHRIRLEISSSNFPHYARNLNTGLSNEDTAETEVAHQTIMHNPGHPAFVELPVVDDNHGFGGDF